MKNRVFLYALALMLLAGTVCWPQDTRGSIVGRVADPSGAVVPGATVVVTSTAMGTKWTFKTADNGYYQATFLIPGMYSIEVSAPGFKKLLRSDIQVQVN